VLAAAGRNRPHSHPGGELLENFKDVDSITNCHRIAFQCHTTQDLLGHGHPELGRGALLYWPRTFDQDVNESSGAFLPVGPVATLETPISARKQVEWLEVFAYVAALHGGPHKGIDRSRN